MCFLQIITETFCIVLTLHFKLIIWNIKYVILAIEVKNKAFFGMNQAFRELVKESNECLFYPLGLDQRTVLLFFAYRT